MYGKRISFLGILQSAKDQELNDINLRNGFWAIIQRSIPNFPYFSPYLGTSMISDPGVYQTEH